VYTEELTRTNALGSFPLCYLFSDHLPEALDFKKKMELLLKVIFPAAMA